MGFSSLDDFISEVTVAGKFRRADWNKNTPTVLVTAAGQWASLSVATAGGNPPGPTLLGVGTNLSMQAGWHDVTPGAGAIQHGGDVAPDTKHILNASSFSAAVTTMPCIFMLVDMLAHIPITTNTVITSQTVLNSTTFTAANATDIITHAAIDIATFSRVQVSNTGGGLPAGLVAATDYWTIRQSATTSRLATSLADAVANVFVDFTTDGTGTQTIAIGLPRYTDGAGVQVFHTPSTAMGAGASNLSFGASGYTNSAGVTGRAIPTSPALPNLQSIAGVSLVDHSGTGAGKFGPFIPLQSGDAGVRSIQSFQLSATRTSGVGNLVFCRPLLTLPMTTLGVAAERDLLNQVPSLPRVFDGACLQWLAYYGVLIPINSAFYGHLDFGWG